MTNSTRNAAIGFGIITVVSLLYLTVDVHTYRKVFQVGVDNLVLSAIYEEKLKGMLGQKRTLASNDVSCNQVKGFVEPCMDFRCKSSVTKQPEVIQEILSKRYKIPDVYQRVIDNMTSEADTTELAIVTAASANHYLEVGGMLKSLNEIVIPAIEKKWSVKIFVYDLGLTETQRQIMEKHCNCQVKDFPFSSLPKFMRNIRSYTWKPLALQAHLSRSDITLWVDASVRFLPGTGILKALAQTYHFGLIVYHGYSSMAQHIHPELVDYFEETHCPFSQYREIVTGSVMLHNEVFVRHVIMDAWVACAFNERCMATTQPGKNWSCNGRVRKYGKCHRFDQAALGMIVVKLFQSKIHEIIGPGYFTFDRADKTLYFPEKV